MFTRPEIAQALGDFILVELYTDGTDAASSETRVLSEPFLYRRLPVYAIVDAERSDRDLPRTDARFRRVPGVSAAVGPPVNPN